MPADPMSAGRGPFPVLPANGSPRLCLHGLAATREVEATALAAEPDGALMRRAGSAVARWSLAMLPHARRWWVAVGPGGNGGDGSFAAARLARLGLDVSLTVYADPDRLPQDAARGLAEARQCGVAVVPGPPAGPTPDAVIDALLGIGSRQEPEGALSDGLSAVTRCAAPCLSIDLPSGLDADSGCVRGGTAVSAHATLSMLTLKPGLFTGSGRRHAGEVWLEPLGRDAAWRLDGLSPQPTAHLLGTADAQPLWALRHQDQHKGHFGDAVVIGGARGMPGAARLAAHSALAAGAGRTVLVWLDPSTSAADPLRPELMCHGVEFLEAGPWLDRATVICGCGGGAAVAEVLPKVLRLAPRLVLDADALNALARDHDLRQLLRNRAELGKQTVLTPHPLEAARLLGCSSADVQADRLVAAATLSAQWQSTVVLKGSGTVVSTPGLPPAINPTGGPALAAGGTGDVLAGWIGGLWAQAPRLASEEKEIAHEAACAATWRHGRAGELVGAGATAVRALDLIEAMRIARAPANARSRGRATGV